MFETLDLKKYDIDKLRYLPIYESFFSPFISKDIRLLELGVGKGGSLLLWRDYFKKGIIVGLDMNYININDPTGTIRFYQGRQEDTLLLDRLSQENAPEGFDIIIDDCSHIGWLTSVSFWHLFENFLKSGGLYCIEDWGTGYWDSWQDGKKYKVQEKKGIKRYNLIDRIITRMPYPKRFLSHDYGMVGFIKTLVDECNMGDITNLSMGGISPHRPTKFKAMHIFPSSLAIIVKA